MNWEYKTIKVGATGFMGGKVDENELNSSLNTLGRQGWELTSAFDTNLHHGTTRDVVLILKRPTGPS